MQLNKKVLKNKKKFHVFCSKSTIFVLAVMLLRETGNVYIKHTTKFYKNVFIYKKSVEGIRDMYNDYI